MTGQLGERLRAVAERAPAVVVPPDLFDRARQRHRRRQMAGVVASALAAIGAGALLPGGSVMRGGRGPADPAGSSGRPFVEVVGGAPGWLGLLVVLTGLGLVWRRRDRAAWLRRMVVVATVGIVVVLSAPPGTALWGEPRGVAGLPDRLAEPGQWTWAADVRSSPTGPMAAVFSGPATYGNLDEGRVAMVAADGERYRVLGVFSDPLAAARFPPAGDRIDRSAAVLSPDGRYFTVDGALLDLTTGESGPVVPGVPVAWSGDGRRLVTEKYQAGGGTLLGWTIWDMEFRRVLWELAATSATRAGTAALSHQGRLLAVEQGGQLEIYDVDEGAAGPSIALDGWRVGDTTAWSPDGAWIAVVRRTSCPPCGEPVTSPQEVRLLDAHTLAPAADLATAPADTAVRVQGWRSAYELVVQIGDEVRVLTAGQPASRLFWLPPGVSQVEVATDALSTKVYAADPATYCPPNGFFWILLGVGAGVVGIVLTVRVAARREARHASDDSF